MGQLGRTLSPALAPLVSAGDHTGGYHSVACHPKGATRIPPRVGRLRQYGAVDAEYRSFATSTGAGSANERMPQRRHHPSDTHRRSSMSTAVTADGIPLSAPLYGASLGQAVSRFFRKYATFTGRASRSEYWWWALVGGVVSTVLYVIALTLGTTGATVSETGTATLGAGFWIGIALYSVWGLAVLIPGPRAGVASPARHEPVGRVLLPRVHPVRRQHHPARLHAHAVRPGRRPLRLIGHVPRSSCRGTVWKCPWGGALLAPPQGVSRVRGRR
ncbi:hypothetical protein QFZ29_003639 [Agromyces albus]|nr:hypothetical protein [Agromyces albus]